MESIVQKEQAGVPVLVFPMLDKLKNVRHLFTTRLGGVSQGIYASMNLGFHRGDTDENVTENYRRIAAAMGCGMEDIVCSHQTHTANIRAVTRQDRGKGLLRPRDYTDVDGLVTDERGICLALSFADCVPVFFVDPVREVIGLAHSGWRGTVSKISAGMVKIMCGRYGCETEHILAAIGPSICRSCYEVSEDVAEAVREAFPAPSVWGRLITPGKEPGKYQLDLWEAVRETLLECGIKPENIAVTDVCTCCNPDLLFSHRASKGQRGNLGAFLRLV